MNFEWDTDKEQLNIKKHHLDFSTAALVFGDKNRLVKYDENHSLDEDRYITIGSVKGFITILFVVYTETANTIRIISARKANKIEKEEYYHANN